MDSDRIKLWFQSGGASISEYSEQYIYYSNCALRLKLITDSHLSHLTIFALMQIISINQLTFPDGFIINHDNSDSGYDFTFEELSIVLYSISGDLFDSQKDLLQSYHSHHLVDKEYRLERSRVLSALLDADVKFLYATG
jgi:hypothetical protein